jgi:hypothetical protein
MIGTLLDDITSGLSFEVVSRRFAEKMNPLQYQRPQVQPKAGNIAQAEKIVEKLGIANSLIRRFARVEELVAVWKPKVKKELPQSGGIFGHLKAKNTGKETPINMDIPPVTMTLDKFMRTVLPYANSIEYYAKNSDNYSAILTAYHEDSTPIIQWDNEEQRNPFSWYVYSGGSPASSWNLSRGYCKVTAITLQPSMWYSDNEHQGKGIFFILEGAKDTRYKNAGSGLFPEILKSELREIRSTIESYSKGETVRGFDEASACGVKLEASRNWDTTLRVTTDEGTAIYKLDRWD